LPAGVDWRFRRCYQPTRRWSPLSRARQGDRGFSSEASILSPPWALADDHLIAAVGRLDLGVDVTPVEARSADGPVHGVAVVYVDEVIPPKPWS
jgi:hypothetical protein